MKLLNVNNIDEKNSTVTLLLYGAIGDKIDGDYFAQEIHYLSDKYDEIILRINSQGGSVMQGLSIFNALLNCKANTVAVIDGIAASMAGVIPMACDEIKMNDFARIMIHDPFIPGKAALTKKEQKTIENMKGVLNSLLSRRGIESDKIAEMMKAETWLKADEALNLKLIDSIVVTGKAPQVENVLSGVAAISDSHFINFLTINKPTTKRMEVLASLFGLQATATEAEIIAKVNELKAENARLTTVANELKVEADRLKAEKETALKAEVETIVAGLIASGLCEATAKENMVKLGQSNPEMFKSVVNGLKKPVAAAQNITNVIAQAQPQGGEVKKDFDWYRKNDPKALAEIESKQPEVFAKMYAEWEAKA